MKLLTYILPLIPRPLVARVARRYVAGPSRSDALRTVRELEANGWKATVDLLGENCRERGECEAAVREYVELLGDLAAQGSEPHVSVKLTHLGLRIAPELASQNLARILERVDELDGFCQIDMEDSSTTDAVLETFRRARERTPRVGVALQAYLRRSPRDLESILPLRPNVRVCKGIYREPAKIALQDREGIRRAFLELVTRLLDGGGEPSIATHDPFLVKECLARVCRYPTRPRHEFQMLLGVGEPLRPEIIQAGSPLRIYCPYGPEWYAYSMRRLRENPRVLGYVVAQLFRR